VGNGAAWLRAACEVLGSRWAWSLHSETGATVEHKVPMGDYVERACPVDCALMAVEDWHE